MDPRDDDANDDFGPDDSADAEPVIRELRAEMIRLQAQIDQIAAAAHDRADEAAILRARLAELLRRIGAVRAIYRRRLKFWVLAALVYGVALGLALAHFLRT